MESEAKRQFDEDQRSNLQQTPDSPEETENKDDQENRGMTVPTTGSDGPDAVESPSAEG